MSRARLVSKLPLEVIKGPMGPQGVEGKPGLNGRDGRDGKDGITPMPFWEDTKLHWRIGDETVKGPDLKGTPGEKGEAGKPGGGGGGSAAQTDKLYEVVTATSSLSSGSTGNRVILADASSGELVITLPRANKYKEFILHVKKVDTSSNNVVIQPQNSELIDKQVSFRLVSDKLPNIMVVSSGAEWFVL